MPSHGGNLVKNTVGQNCWSLCKLTDELKKVIYHLVGVDTKLAELEARIVALEARQ